MAHKRAIAQLDNLFSAPVTADAAPARKKKPPRASGGTRSKAAAATNSATAAAATMSSTGGAGPVTAHDDWYSELPRQFYSAHKCPADYVDALLKTTLTESQGGSASRAQSIVQSKLRNKVITLQNQSRQSSSSSQSQQGAQQHQQRRRHQHRHQARRPLGAEEVFPFGAKRLSNKALRRRGLLQQPTAPSPAGTASRVPTAATASNSDAAADHGPDGVVDDSVDGADTDDADADAAAVVRAPPRRRASTPPPPLPASAVRLTPAHCAQMHRWWHDYAMGVLERHPRVALSVLFARIDLHGAPVAVTRARADPLLVGLQGTLLQQTRHTVTLFNEATGQVHACIPKKGTVFVVAVAGLTAHVEGDSLVESW